MSNYSQPENDRLVNVLTSRKLSSTLIVAGFLVFLIPFLQFPSAVLLFIGSFINAASDKTKQQKLLWLLPLAVCAVLVVVVVLYW
jgi:hypothetical protein